jgi:hypothetical protein
MKVSLLDNALWAASFIGNLVLFGVLLAHKRWKQFPVFTTLIGYYAAESAILFLVYRFSPLHYVLIYWITFAVDFLLQVALIVEVTRIVLQPTGTLFRDERTRFIIFGFFGALIALGLTFAIHPSTPRTVDAWGIRAYLLTSLIFCEMFLVTMFTAQKLGLVWRNHVMSLGQGLTAWAIISAMVDVAHSYYGTTHVNDFRMLEHIRSIAYIGAVVYWTIAFWLPEPERRPVSAEMQKYLIALHQKVQYDATQVSSAQNSR